MDAIRLLSCIRMSILAYHGHAIEVHVRISIEASDGPNQPSFQV
uniref:Uncharacterized protein n=1 Tax=Rhizophora mucronata TaxID=61149 RepID=A0A2P2MY93_RHIMU